MSWKPTPTLSRAAEIVDNIMEAAATFGMEPDGGNVDLILLHHRLVSLIENALFVERKTGIGEGEMEAVKRDNRRYAADGQLPMGWHIDEQGMIIVDGLPIGPIPVGHVPYSKTKEYQAKLAEQRRQHDEQKRRIDKENGLDELEKFAKDVLAARDKAAQDYMPKIHEKRPGSVVNDAADIAAHQEESGEAELVRWARSRHLDTSRPITPLAPGLPPGTVIFHNGEPYVVSISGVAYPPAKDNLQDLAATVKTQAETIQKQAEEIFAKAAQLGAENLSRASAAMLAEKLDASAPPPGGPDHAPRGGIIDTHVGVQWGDGPTAGLMAEETLTSEEAVAMITLGGPTSKPLGNVAGAPVDGEMPAAKGGQPKKKVGRPKGSYGKKKREAMRKAKAAERAKLKAEKASLYPTLDEAPESGGPDYPDPGEGAAPVVTMDLHEIESPTTVEVDPDTVDVHAHMGSEEQP